MRRMMTAWLIALFLAVLAIASGCEDSAAIVGKDFQLSILANPSTVRVDAENENPTSTIVATVANATGAPQAGVLVFFSSDGGVLSSNTQGVETDTNGNAFDTLTVSAEDSDEIEVTATSTTLSDTVTVEKACSNAAPTASFLVSNPDPLPTGATSVVHPTDASSDVAPGVIVSYAWDCGNSTSGGTTSTPTCNYVVGAEDKIYTITLTVRDDGISGAACFKTSTTTKQVTIRRLV